MEVMEDSQLWRTHGCPCFGGFTIILASCTLTQCLGYQRWVDSFFFFEFILNNNNNKFETGIGYTIDHCSPLVPFLSYLVIRGSSW